MTPHLSVFTEFCHWTVEKPSEKGRMEVRGGERGGSGKSAVREEG